MARKGKTNSSFPELAKLDIRQSNMVECMYRILTSTSVWNSSYSSVLQPRCGGEPSCEMICAWNSRKNMCFCHTITMKSEINTGQIPVKPYSCAALPHRPNNQECLSNTGVLLLGKARTGPALVLIDSYHWNTPLNM